MVCRLIDQRVRFGYYTKWGGRYWYLNNLYHREDGGPAIERTNMFYRAWYEHGEYMMENR